MKHYLIFAALCLLPALAVHAQERPSIVVAAPNVEWLEFDEALDVAAATGKKILIDVYAPWCGFCRRMHAETYAQEDVSAYLAENFVATRVNGDDSDTVYEFRGHSFTGQELGYHLGARGFPTTVFLFSDGNYLTPLPGFVDSENILFVLSFLATDAFENESFEDYLARTR